MMTAKKFVEKLPQPVTCEEKLIYNFLSGKTVFQVEPVKTKDRYLQALLAYLKDNQQVIVAAEKTSSKRKAKSEE